MESQNLKMVRCPACGRLVVEGRACARCATSSSVRTNPRRPAWLAKHWQFGLGLSALLLIGALIVIYGVSRSPTASPGQDATLTVQDIKRIAVAGDFRELLYDKSNIGLVVRFRGQVTQLLPEGDDGNDFLIAVREAPYGYDPSEAVYIHWTSASYVLEGDVLDVWGVFKGTLDYTTALGVPKRALLLDGLYLEILEVETQAETQ
ncbi:MAG: hypothetical protein M1325_01205 [Actinobacteria bacterium]|nr:hypothetical protein [Actinomycetota bacterium]